MEGEREGGGVAVWRDQWSYTAKREARLRRRAQPHLPEAICSTEAERDRRRRRRRKRP